MWDNISLWFWFACHRWLVMLNIFSCTCWPSAFLLFWKFRVWGGWAGPLGKNQQKRALGLTLKIEGLTGLMFCPLEIFCQSSRGEWKNKNEEAFDDFSFFRINFSLWTYEMSRENLSFFLSFFLCPSKYLSACYMSNGLPSWLRQWRICLQCRRPWFDHWVGKIPWRE